MATLLKGKDEAQPRNLCRQRLGVSRVGWGSTIRLPVAPGLVWVGNRAGASGGNSYN